MKNQQILAAVLALSVALWVGSLAEARPPDTADDLSKQIKDLRDEIDTLRRARALERQAVNRKLSELDEKLDRIEQLLRGTVTTRTARSLSPEMRTGIIRLDNRLGVEATVTIDGVVYTVPPLRVVVLRDRPLGAFTYEVTADGFGFTGSRRRTLDSRPWTLTIY
jgi:hypothetical protein